MHRPFFSQETRLRFVLISLLLIWANLTYNISSSETKAALHLSGNQVAELNDELSTVFQNPPPARQIAHAGGLYFGRVYTNSVAALQHSYDRGFRIHEVDLHLTSDNQIVLLHDWEASVQNLYGLAPGPRPLADFKRETAGHPYNVATPTELVAWMDARPDVFVVLDTKVNTVGMLRTIAELRPDLIDRFIPYIYAFDQYEPVRAMGYRHVSLLAREGQFTPQELVTFAGTHRLHSLAVPLSYQAHVPELSKVAPVYCWTINDQSTVKAVRAAGAFGVITDVIVPDNLD